MCIIGNMMYNNRTYGRATSAPNVKDKNSDGTYDDLDWVEEMDAAVEEMRGERGI